MVIGRMNAAFGVRFFPLDFRFVALFFLVALFLAPLRELFFAPAFFFVAIEGFSCWGIRMVPW
jgi:hypothetical protein